MSILAIILWLELFHELLMAGASEMAWGKYKTHKLNVEMGSYSFQDSLSGNKVRRQKSGKYHAHIYELPLNRQKLRKETQRYGKNVCGSLGSFVTVFLYSFAWFCLYPCFWSGKPNALIVPVSRYVNIKLLNQHFYVKKWK